MATRYERLASRSRRLEVVAAAAAVTFTVVMCRLAPGSTAPAEAAPLASGSGRAAGTRPAEVRPEAPAAPLPRSAPVRVRIAGTGVDATVLTSLRAGGALPDAPPGRPMQVAWDAAGAAPGEDGPASLVGRLDSEDGPAAFAGLGGLRAGARVAVERADGRTVRFRVRAVERYGAAGSPEDFLLAAASGEGPRLRLVARGGAGTTGKGDDVTVVALAHVTSG